MKNKLINGNYNNGMIAFSMMIFFLNMINKTSGSKLIVSTAVAAVLLVMGLAITVIKIKQK